MEAIRLRLHLVMHVFYIHWFEGKKNLLEFNIVLSNVESNTKFLSNPWNVVVALNPFQEYVTQSMSSYFVICVELSGYIF